jgi:hypothetical protein
MPALGQDWLRQGYCPAPFGYLISRMRQKWAGISNESQPAGTLGWVPQA